MPRHCQTVSQPAPCQNIVRDDIAKVYWAPHIINRLLQKGSKIFLQMWKKNSDLDTIKMFEANTICNFQPICNTRETGRTSDTFFKIVQRAQCACVVTFLFNHQVQSIVSFSSSKWLADNRWEGEAINCSSRNTLKLSALIKGAQDPGLRIT